MSMYLLGLIQLKLQLRQLLDGCLNSGLRAGADLQQSSSVMQGRATALTKHCNAQ